TVPLLAVVTLNASATPAALLSEVASTFWLPNTNVAGAGAGVTPVPVRMTPCGLPVALSNTCSVALRAPFAVGVNVTFTVQVLPAPIGDVARHVFAEIAKSVPAIDRLVIDSGAVPLLRTVTV